MTQLPIARIEGTATPSSARTVKTSCAAWECGRDPGRPAGTCGKNTVDLFMKLSMKSLQGDVQKNVDAHTVEDFMRIKMSMRISMKSLQGDWTMMNYGP